MAGEVAAMFGGGSVAPLVQSGQSEFEHRYVREYLDSEKFRGFDEALVRLMQLLDLPGIGMVMIDGIPRTGRSRNTPPAERVPEVLAS